MPEVQSVGAADYTQSYQPVQYQENYTNDMNEMPVVYDEAVEPKKSSFGIKGLAILGTLAAVGIGIGCYKLGGKNAAKELDALKNSEAVKNYDSMKEAFNSMKDAVNELEKDADGIIKPKTVWQKITGLFTKDKGFAQKTKDKVINPYKEKAEKIEKAIKEAAEEAGEAVEEAV